MEENSIFKILSQLENDLSDIKSAKEQIDLVLQEDSEINNNLAIYNKRLASISNQLSDRKSVV